MPTSTKDGVLKRLRAWPNSWVMLHEADGFVRLPGERVLYTSPPRTTLALQTPNTYPGKDPLAVHSSAGCAYLTNQRVRLPRATHVRCHCPATDQQSQIVYLPASPTPHLQSFSAPILNLHDTRVSAPFFGPNVWSGILQPVAGGGIPPVHAYVELKMVFKDGGAFDFHSKYEQVKERLQQAVEIARENGHMNGDGSEIGAGRGGGALAGVNLAAIHLEQLPAYEEAGTGVNPPTAAGMQSAPRSVGEPRPTALRDSGVMLPSDDERGSKPSPDDHTVDEPSQPPTEPPPGYEEVQQSSVASELEMRLRRAS